MQNIDLSLTCHDVHYICKPKRMQNIDLSFTCHGVYYICKPKLMQNIDISLTCHGVYYICTTKYIVFYNLVHVDIVVKEIITSGE